jgi:hypothetical protein
MTVLVVLIVVLVILLGLAGAAFIYMRGIWREQKNYERGLKMVPVLIHLPRRPRRYKREHQPGPDAVRHFIEHLPEGF